MLVAVFRARGDGERTAERLRELGHEAVLAPVFDVVPTGKALPDGPFDGVIFTSAHGIEALAGRDMTGLLDLPCYCVGNRTAACAQAAGWTDIRAGRADADRLASLIEAGFSSPARLLLVAGRDRKPAIERRLAAAGHHVDVAEVYEARALLSWPLRVTMAFRHHEVDAALHYSRRSATLALDCAVAGAATTGFLGCTHHCLSGDAAEPLRRAGAGNLVVATEPDENSLLRTLAKQGRD